MTIYAFMNSWIVSEFDIASQCIVMNVASRASTTLLFQSAMRVFFEFLRVPVAKKHQEEEEEVMISYIWVSWTPVCLAFTVRLWRRSLTGFAWSLEKFLACINARRYSATSSAVSADSTWKKRCYNATECTAWHEINSTWLYLVARTVGVIKHW